jgi:hypothetical protein
MASDTSSASLNITELLWYEVFNPSEVVPEFTSDIGTKSPV